MIVQSREIKAHQSILSRASPVFDLYFKASKEFVDVLEIADPRISYYALNEMLRFIYFKKFMLIDGETLKSSLELFTAAHVYKVNELRKMCLEYVGKMLKYNREAYDKSFNEIRQTNSQLLDDFLIAWVRIH